MVVVMVVVKRRAVVVLLCVRKRFFRMVGKVMSFLSTIVVCVVMRTSVPVSIVMDDWVVHDGLWVVVMIIVHNPNMVVVVDDVVHDM